MKKTDKPELPLGFGMALSQNIDAMKYFCSLTDEKQKQIIKKTQNINSSQEMKQFISSLTNLK